ncbi:hypothetical protein Tco_1105210 [Tanacetum coccineum]
MVSSSHGSSPMASGSLNTTRLAERFNKLERQMLDGKLLNKVDSDPVNSNSDSDVEVDYDETDQSWLEEVQMMQAYMRTNIMKSMILMILKV